MASRMGTIVERYLQHAIECGQAIIPSGGKGGAASDTARRVSGLCFTRTSIFNTDVMFQTKTQVTSRATTTPSELTVAIKQ